MSLTHYDAINWNQVSDMIDKATWEKLTEQFWLDTRIPVSNDLDDWRQLDDDHKWVVGVEIPYEKGLLGHSDADVLAHAVMDAVLGAAALGDIGKHFPDTDPEYAGADGLMLARHVARIVRENGWKVENRKRL